MTEIVPIGSCRGQLIVADVRFSNRPFEVKRFQTSHRCRCRSWARASLRNRHQSPSSMGFENEPDEVLDALNTDTCPF